MKSRHKGKLETEAYLRNIGIPFTSIRPTYIYGPLNYNPLGNRRELLLLIILRLFYIVFAEEYFFERLSEGRRVCIPGHGQVHLLFTFICLRASIIHWALICSISLVWDTSPTSPPPWLKSSVAIRPRGRSTLN